MANQLDKYDNAIESTAAIIMLVPAIANTIRTAQNDKQRWHWQTFPTTLHTACDSPKCTAMVQPIITAMAITIIMTR